MIEITIYDMNTGVIRRCGIFPDMENCLVNIEADENTVLGHYDPNKYYINKAGVAIEYPTKPNRWCKWNGVEWFDPRTPEQLEQDDLDHIQSVRERASLTKYEFIMRSVQAGIITQQSGLAVLDGQIPTELEGITFTLTDWEVFQLQAKIKAAQQFDRLDPFIIAAGQFLGMSDVEVDQLFGITY